MEIQVPLILFTSFLAWAGGTFAAQGVLAIKKQGAKIQMTSLVVAFVLLVLGGILVLFHLERPLHIFNGFGNPTSGITQELIAIVLIGIWMIVYFVMIRQSKDGNVPSWCGIVAIILAAALDIVMSHSYMMAARPTWNSVFQILSIVGASCAAGPATVMLIAAVKSEKTEEGEKAEKIEVLKPLVFWGAIVGAATTVIYLVVMCVMGSSFVDLGNYFDPTHPNAGMTTGSDINVFTSAASTITTIITLLGCVASIFGAYKAKTCEDKQKVWAGVALAGAIVAIVALRIVFYILGNAVLLFY